jgi:hypothetical protein
VTLKDNFVASKPHTKLYRSCKIVAIWNTLSFRYFELQNTPSRLYLLNYKIFFYNVNTLKMFQVSFFKYVQDFKYDFCPIFVSKHECFECPCFDV